MTSPEGTKTDPAHSDVEDDPEESSGCRGQISTALWLLLFFTGALITFCVGVQALVEAWKFPAPEVVSYHEFVRRQPREGWFRITDGALSVGSSLVISMDSTVHSVVMPVVPKNLDAPKECPLFLESEDEALIRAVDELPLPPRPATPKQIFQYTQKNFDKLWLHRPIEGLVRTGVNGSFFQPKEATRLQVPVSDHFVILKDGYRPNFRNSLLQTVIAGILLLLFLFFFVRKGIIILRGDW